VFQVTRVSSILLLLGLACASAPPPIAEAPIDWESLDEHWSLHIVTVDPDGDERVTRIWLALSDGLGVLRTGESRWWQNLQRDPACRIRLRGTDYPLRAEFVEEKEEKARIDDAFAEKYGWLERVLFPQERGETHQNYARLRPAEGAGESGQHQRARR
jgi:hypothetical protein